MEPVLVSQNVDAVTISFARPDKRNALTIAASEAVAAALDRHVETALPVVFRSTTAGMFVAGTDVAELQERTLADSLRRTNARLFQRIADHPWPTIAAVDGAALGGGCELALACDFRITTEEAQWGLPEVTLGLVPSAGGVSRLARLVGEPATTDLVLTGRRVRGHEAHALGLASRIARAGELDQAVTELLAQLGRGSTLAQRLAKEAMRVEGDRHRLVDATAQALCLATADTQRRLQAFLDASAAKR